MNREPAGSSQIRSIGYDRRTQTLEVEFHSGSVYTCRHFPEKMFRRFRASGSKGTFMCEHFRGSYALTRLQCPAPENSPA